MSPVQLKDQTIQSHLQSQLRSPEFDCGGQSAKTKQVQTRREHADSLQNPNPSNCEVTITRAKVHTNI